MKYRVIIFVFCFLLFSFHLTAADTWLRFYDPFDEAIFSVEDVLVCSDGGYAINGTCIDQQTTIGWGFVIKTDSEGNMLWARRDTVSFQSENDSRAFVETDDGGIISASYHYSSGTALIKRDYEGGKEWGYLIEGTAIESFDETENGNFIGGGRKIISETVWPNLIKMDQNGVQIWEKNYIFNNYGYGNISAVIQSLDGGYLLAGSLYLSNNSDLLVIKTDANGDSLWTRILDVTDRDDEARTIIENNEGDIFVGGYLEGITAGFLWKLSSEGDTIWLEKGTGSCGYGFRSFSKSNDNSIVSIFGDLEVNHSLRKFDDNYNIEWTNALPYSTGSGDKAVKITLSQNIVVVLYYPSSRVALMKLNPDGTDVDENFIDISQTVLNAYPNPFNPMVQFSFTLKRDSNTSIKIFDTKGQLVSILDEGMLNRGEHTVQWQAVNLASGFYFAQLHADKRILDTKKMILTK